MVTWVKITPQGNTIQFRTSAMRWIQAAPGHMRDKRRIWQRKIGKLTLIAMNVTSCLLICWFGISAHSHNFFINASSLRKETGNVYSTFNFHIAVHRTDLSLSPASHGNTNIFKQHLEFSLYPRLLQCHLVILEHIMPKR